MPNDPVLDSTSNVIVLAFDLAGSEIAAMPDQLAKALQQHPVELAIQQVLASFALNKQQQGTTTVNDAEAKQLATDLWNKAGGKLTDSVLAQLKQTPEFKRLDQSLTDLEKSLKNSSLGVWVDKNKNILYVVGIGLAIGGAIALYATKTSGTVLNAGFSQLTGKPVQIFKVGGFSLSGQMLSFKPDAREIGGGLVGTEKWDKVQLSLEFGVVATGSDVKQINGKIVLKTKDINLGLTGSGDLTKNTVNLGISLGIDNGGVYGPLNISVTGVVKNGRLTGGGLQGDWQLDNTSAISVQGTSAGGETKGMVLFTKRF